MQTLYRILVRLGVVAAIPSLILLVVGGVSYFNGQRAIANDPYAEFKPAADCQADPAVEPWVCYRAIEVPSPYVGPLSVSVFLATIPVGLWLVAWAVKPGPQRNEL